MKHKVSLKSHKLQLGEQPSSIYHSTTSTCWTKILLLDTLEFFPQISSPQLCQVPHSSSHGFLPVQAMWQQAGFLLHPERGKWTSLSIHAMFAKSQVSTTRFPRSMTHNGLYSTRIVIIVNFNSYVLNCCKSKHLDAISSATRYETWLILAYISYS